MLSTALVSYSISTSTAEALVLDQNYWIGESNGANLSWNDDDLWSLSHNPYPSDCAIFNGGGTYRVNGSDGWGASKVYRIEVTDNSLVNLYYGGNFSTDFNVGEINVSSGALYLTDKMCVYMSDSMDGNPTSQNVVVGENAAFGIYDSYSRISGANFYINSNFKLDASTGYAISGFDNSGYKASCDIFEAAGFSINNNAELQIYEKTNIGTILGTGTLKLYGDSSSSHIIGQITEGQTLILDDDVNVTIQGNSSLAKISTSSDDGKILMAGADLKLLNGGSTISNLSVGNLSILGDSMSSIVTVQASGMISSNGDIEIAGSDSRSSIASSLDIAGDLEVAQGLFSITSTQDSYIGRNQEVNHSSSFVDLSISGNLILQGKASHDLVVEGDLSLGGQICLDVVDSSIWGGGTLSLGSNKASTSLTINSIPNNGSALIQMDKLIIKSNQLNVVVSASVLSQFDFSHLNELTIFECKIPEYGNAISVPDEFVALLNGKESYAWGQYNLILDTYAENGNAYFVIRADEYLEPAPFTITWISTDGVWDNSAGDWMGATPVSDSTVYFSGEGSTSVQLDGAKTVNTVNVSGADYTFTGDCLTTTSMNVDAPSLSLENDVTVTGSLKAAAADIVNDGTLSVGNGSDLQSLSGSGSFVLLANATASVDALSQAAVTIQSGAKLLLGSANVSLASLNNAGSLTTTGSLSLTTAATTTGGDVSVGSLAIVTGSTFGDLTCSSLSIDGALSTTGAMLSVGSLSGDITLDLLNFDSTIAAGTYDIITGVGSLTWDDITLSDDMQLAMGDFVDAYKELEWSATNGTLQLIVTSVIPSPDDLSWVGGTGTLDHPIVWDDTESNWTGTPDGWEGTLIPGNSTDISFNLSDSTYISLDGAKVVEDTVVTNAGAGAVSLNLSGDALTTDSLTSTGVDIHLSNTTKVKGATTLTSADLTVAATGLLTTDSLSADASSSIVNAGVTTVTGALTAEAVTNSGSLSIGTGSDITSLTGDGVLVVLAKSNASVERMEQDGLTLKDGASLVLGSADTSVETTSVKVLTNAGSITSSNALEVETKTDVGGDVTAPALSLQAGSTFSDLLVDSLTIEGSITTGVAALTVDSLAVQAAESISLDVTSFSSAWDNGTYTIIAGDSSLAWSDVSVSQAMLDVASAIAAQDRVVQWNDSGDSLQIVILAGSPRYWSSSTDYSIMMDDGQAVDGSERSLFVNKESGEIVSYTNFQNVVGIQIDADAKIDLSISLAPEAGQTLQLQNMTGVAGATLSLVGTDAATHTATLSNTGATVANNAIIATDIQLNVENAGGASLTLGSLQLDGASVNIVSGAQLILGSLSEVAGTVNTLVNDGQLTLQSGQVSTLVLAGSGKTIIAKNSSVGLGCIDDVAIELQSGSTLNVSQDSKLGALTGTGTLDASSVVLTLENDLTTSATVKAQELVVHADVQFSVLSLGTGASISSADDSLSVTKLNAAGASIANEGTLSLGNASHVSAISGDGKLVIMKDASVTVDSFTSSSLRLESGSTITINSDATLIDLVNLGTLVMENNTLTLGAAVASISSGVATIASTPVMTGSIIAKNLIINDDRAIDQLTVKDSLVVNNSGSLKVNALSSDNVNAVVSGTVQVIGAGGDYQGTYVDAVIDLADSSTTQTLVTGDSLALTGSAGSFVLNEGAASTALKSINTTGANLDLTHLGATSLDLGEASSLADASLAIAFDAAAFARTETAQVVFTGAAMTMSNVNVVLSALDESVLSQLKGISKTEDVVLLDFGSAVTATGTDIEIEGSTLNKYLKSAKFVGSQLIVDVNTTFYEDAIVSGNGAAGMKMIATVYDSIDPQRDPAGKYTDLASAMDSIDDMLIVNDHNGVNSLSTAMAGASTTALGSAMMSEIERQLRSSNNRARTEAQPGMGGKGGSAWIAAESNFDRLGNNGTYGGHHFSSYGGSVGMDLMTGRGTSFGVSFTAMRGDLSSSMGDSGDGSLNTNFMSLYGKVVSGNWKHSYAMSFGWGSGDLDRTIAHANGYYKTSGDSDTHAFGVMYEASYDVSDTWSILANTSLQNSVAGAYTEAGSDAGLNVGRQSSTWATFGLGLNAAMELGETAVNRTCSLNTRAMLKFYAGDTGSAADVGFTAGGEQAYVRGTEAGAVAIEFATGLVIPITNEGDDIFVDAAVQLRDEQSSVNVTAGYRCSF